MLYGYQLRQGDARKHWYMKGTTALRWDRLSAGMRAKGVFRVAVMLRETHGRMARGIKPSGQGH